MNPMDNETYSKEGKEYERVTRIINYFLPPELVDYKVRVGNRVANASMKKAGKFGTMIDEAIRLNWKEPAIKKPCAESKEALKAWDSWKWDNAVEDISFPETLYSEELLIAGTPDFVWKNMIVDIKCSSGVKPIYFAQLGAYASMSGVKPEDLAVLRLDKNTGMYEFIKASAVGLSVDACVSYFLSLVYSFRTYKQVQSTLKPKENINGTDSE